MLFGKMFTNEMGTYLIAYASTFSTVQKMLNNMFIGSPTGNYDRILDFSTAKTGGLFFVPTFNMIEDFSN
jgi:putative iron-dependent peroxidase